MPKILPTLAKEIICVGLEDYYPVLQYLCLSLHNSTLQHTDQKRQFVGFEHD